MADLLDYIAWRGDLPFSEAPMNGLDALCLAVFSYEKLPPEAVGPAGMPLSDIPVEPVEEEANFRNRRARLLRMMTRSARFGGARVCYAADQVDAALGMQFAACCVDITPEIRVVCFRGTDATMVGWREDFTMSYECPVPSQTAAAVYLAGVARETDARLVTTGHSKGGNLAVYAALSVRLPEERLLSAWSFDGPGFMEPVLASEGYRRVQPRMHVVIPESSVVGRLMGHHAEQTIVRSGAVGLQQHNPFNWRVAPPEGFELAPETTVSSQITNRSIDAWLLKASPEQRRMAVDAVFTLTNLTGAESPSQIKRGILKNFPKALRTLNGFDTQTKLILGRLLIHAASLTAAGVLDRAAGTAVGQAAEELIQRWIAKGDV